MRFGSFVGKNENECPRANYIRVKDDVFVSHGNFPDGLLVIRKREVGRRGDQTVRASFDAILATSNVSRNISDNIRPCFNASNGKTMKPSAETRLSRVQISPVALVFSKFKVSLIETLLFGDTLG